MGLAPLPLSWEHDLHARGHRRAIDIDDRVGIRAQQISERSSVLDLPRRLALSREDDPRPVCLELCGGLTRDTTVELVADGRALELIHGKNTAAVGKGVDLAQENVRDLIGRQSLDGIRYADDDYG